MKVQLTLLSFALVVGAGHAVFHDLVDNDGLQSVLLDESYLGYDIDLKARRLVQLDLSERPVVMTELEKVE